MSHEPDNVTDLPPPGPPDPLARALARLEPAAAHLDRDRLMFQAGAESRRAVIRLWQFTAGVLAAVGFAAGARVYFYEPERVEKIVYIEREVPPAQGIAPPPREAPTLPEPDNAAIPPGNGGPNRRNPGNGPPSETHPAPPGHLLMGPGEMAPWLQLRNDILTGGLGMLPDYGPQAPPRPPFEE